MVLWIQSRSVKSVDAIVTGALTIAACLTALKSNLAAHTHRLSHRHRHRRRRLHFPKKLMIIITFRIRSYDPLQS